MKLHLKRDKTKVKKFLDAVYRRITILIFKEKNKEHFYFWLLDLLSYSEPIKIASLYFVSFSFIRLHHLTSMFSVYFDNSDITVLCETHNPVIM